MKQKIVWLLLIAALTFSLVALIKTGMDDTALQPPAPSYEQLAFQGTCRINGGGEISIPQNFSGLSGSNRIVLTGHFSQDIPENVSLYMRVDNLRVSLLVNGREVFCYGKEGSFPAYARSGGNGWRSFSSPTIYSDDEITITLENVYTNHVDASFNLFLHNLYADRGDGLIMSAIRNGLLNNVYAVAISCLGLLMLIFGIALRSFAQISRQIRLFGCFVISAGVWFGIDFNVQSIYIPQGVFSNTVDIVSLCFMTIFLLLYLCTYLSKRSAIILQSVAAGDMVLLIAAAILQFSGICDYYDLTDICNILTILGIVSIVASLIYETMVLKSSALRGLLPSILALCVGGLADAACYGLGLLPYTLWFKISFLIFLLFQIRLFSRSIAQIADENAHSKILKGIAYRDPLTKVRNRTSYLEYIADLATRKEPFGVGVFDLNGLKQVNDTFGHEAGDRYLINACRVICSAYKTSPVFRIGGDEFVAIFENIAPLPPQTVQKQIAAASADYNALHSSDVPVSIACGVSFFDPLVDQSYNEVFVRADRLMYENKRCMKESSSIA